MRPSEAAILAGCDAYTKDGQLRPHQNVYEAVAAILEAAYKVDGLGAPAPSGPQEPGPAEGYALDCRDLYEAERQRAIGAGIKPEAAHECGLMVVYLQGKSGARFQGGAVPAPSGVPREILLRVARSDHGYDGKPCWCGKLGAYNEPHKDYCVAAQEALRAVPEKGGET